MIGMCIYAGNRGLGPCEGPISKITVASKRTAAWKGLQALAERLQATEEEPGVCEFHQARALENGYQLAKEAPTPRKRTTRSAAARSPHASASAPAGHTAAEL
jgi:hypothetical protein